MHKAQRLVQDFHREVMSAPTSPAEPKLRHPELRASLIMEEAIETVVALVGAAKAQSIIQTQLLEVLRTSSKQEPDIVEAIDGLCDLIYVAYGSAEDIGVDLEPFYDEVQRSNMAKKGGTRRPDGKWLKPEGWTAPDIAGVLAHQLEVRAYEEKLKKDPPTEL